MPRIRTVRPELWTSLTVAKLTWGARLTFIALLNFADDEGRLSYDPRILKGWIWPLDDDVTAATVNDFVTEMVTVGLVTVYGTRDAKRYLCVNGFLEHQRINKPTASKFPAPPVSTPGALSEDSAQEGKGREQGTGKGKDLGKEISRAEDKRTTLPAPPAASADDGEIEVQPWLAPISDVWNRRFGPGTFSDKHAKALTALHNRGVPSAEVAQHLANYLAVANEPYVSIPKFTQTYGEWAVSRQKGKDRLAESMANITESMEETPHGMPAPTKPPAGLGLVRVVEASGNEQIGDPVEITRPAPFQPIEARPAAVSAVAGPSATPNGGVRCPRCGESGPWPVPILDDHGNAVRQLVDVTDGHGGVVTRAGEVKTRLTTHHDCDGGADQSAATSGTS